MYAAKAWIALAGAIVTALLASGVVPVDGTLQNVLTYLSVILTAVSTYVVRNNGTDVPKEEVS